MIRIVKSLISLEFLDKKFFLFFLFVNLGGGFLKISVIGDILKFLNVILGLDLFILFIFNY